MPTADEVRRQIVRLVSERLPRAWTLTPSAAAQGSVSAVDFVLLLRAPDDGAARLVFEVRQVVERRDVGRIAESALATAGGSDVWVVAARYLSASVREALTAQGLSYADATGNLRISVDAPALFIADRGEDRDPWRRGRPLGTLMRARGAGVSGVAGLRP